MSEDPNIVIVRSKSVLEPVADGVPSTDDVEPSAVAVTVATEPSAMSKLAKLEDAVPTAVVVSPLAVSSNTPVEKLTSPMGVLKLSLKEASELLTL
jgi:hypothetical protein